MANKGQNERSEWQRIHDELIAQAAGIERLIGEEQAKYTHSAIWVSTDDTARLKSSKDLQRALNEIMGEVCALRMKLGLLKEITVRRPLKVVPKGRVAK